MIVYWINWQQKWRSFFFFSCIGLSGDYWRWYKRKTFFHFGRRLIFPFSFPSFSLFPRSGRYSSTLPGVRVFQWSDSRYGGYSQHNNLAMGTGTGHINHASTLTSVHGSDRAHGGRPQTTLRVWHLLSNSLQRLVSIRCWAMQMDTAFMG